MPEYTLQGQILGYLLCVVYTLLALGESVAVKAYAKRHGSGGMLMNAVIALFATLFFLFSDIVKGDGFCVPSAMLPIALINCLLFAAGFYFGFVAFKIGPFGLTRLISSFSLLFSIFYGIFFLHEDTTWLTYIAIVMVFAAMVLINYKSLAKQPKISNAGDDTKKSTDEAADANTVSLKWLLCLMVSVVANGFIVILTKLQQNMFNKICDNEFQIISIGGSFILLTVIGLIVDRDKLATVAKNGILYGGVSGLFNGAKNLITLLILPLLPLSVISPTKTGLGMVVAFLTAIFFYKERYTPLQIVGVALGAGAVVLLAL